MAPEGGRRGRLRVTPVPTPLPLLNVVAGLVYALAMPFMALVTSYVYFDLRVRRELAPAHAPRELPAEIELGT